MSLPKIQALWISGALSTLERLSIASFIANGHSVDLYAYEEIPNIPHGTNLVDVSIIIPRSELFTASTSIGKGSWGPFSDLFRFTLLYKNGGIWADLDLICLKPIDFTSVRPLFASEWVRDQSHPDKVVGGATTCFIYTPIGHPLIDECRILCSSIARVQKNWADSGPGVVRTVISRHRNQEHVLSPQVFCSVPHWNIQQLIIGCHLIEPNAYGLHFWNEVWRWNFLNKDRSYDENSIFERLKFRFLPS